jgi:trk system potassium uptake protein
MLRWPFSLRTPLPVGCVPLPPPPQLFAGSFALLIAVGTVGLKVLPGLYGPGHAPLSWTDALFTSTSAVCVTGLIVVDTATYFTVWGQAWILGLIQLGGLGVVTFTSLIIASLGRRLSLRQETFTTVMTDVAPHVDTRRLVRDVVLFTVVIELAGALALLASFGARLGFTEALWPAVFHAVSAFCNAGFSTFSRSLITFQESGAVLTAISALIVVGGLGFLTLEEVYLWRRATLTGRRFRVSLHSRLVLVTTGVLLVGGTLAAALFEGDGLFRDMTPGVRWLNAFFVSVTARTAGFNAIHYPDASAATNFLTVLLMTVGGSPGSTAGGIKTTTLALLVLVAWARLRGRSSVDAFGRSIPSATAARAFSVTLLGAFVLVAATLLLIATERGANDRFLALLFEAVSALGTAGLSLDVTPTLSTPGRLLVIVLMFVGRVGPLTVAAALARPRRAATPRFAYEDVMVG